jgi:beta-xylosidase
MDALEEFEVTLTFCFTPEHRGIAPHYTSPPLVPQEFADFCARMTNRYARKVERFSQHPVLGSWQATARV